MPEEAPPNADASETDSSPSEQTPPIEAGEGTEMDLAAEVDKWKALSRKNEDRAKANEEAAKRLAEIEDAKKSDSERQAEALKATEGERDSAVAEAARLRAAIKHGLSEDDLDLLGDGTAEEIEGRAERLAQRISESSNGRKPTKTLGQTQETKSDPDAWLREQARR